MRTPQAAVVVGAAAHAASRASSPPLPLRGPAKVTAGPLLAFVSTPTGSKLTPIDQRTSRARPGRSLALPYIDAWAISPDRSLLALALHVHPVNEPNTLQLVELRSLRRVHRRIGLGGDVSALAWIGPHRLAALVGGVLCCPAQLSVEVADLRAGGRVLRGQSLAGTILVIGRLPRGLVLLMAPTDAIGPASLVTIDRRGVRTVLLSRIVAGQIASGAGISQDQIPGLAIDPSGAHAYVIDASGTVADIDPKTLAVSYHALTNISHQRRLETARTPTAREKGDEGPVRTARWLGNGMLLVAGSNLQDTSQRLQSDPAGLKLINTRNWTTTTLEPEADSFALTDGLLLATGAHWHGNTNPTGMGLATFGPDARPRLRLFAGRAVGVDRVLAGRAYIYGYGWKRDHVVDLHSGHLVGTRADNLPEPLLDTGSLPGRE